MPQQSEYIYTQFFCSIITYHHHQPIYVHKQFAHNNLVPIHASIRHMLTV
jgi:hypothetical protein